MNKSEKELYKWRDPPCSWTGRFNIVKLSVLPNLMYIFKETTVKIPASYFVDISKFILGNRPRIANTILKEKNKIGGLSLPNVKTYYKATVIKTLWYWCQNRQKDQRKRIKSPEIDPHKYSQLIFDKGAKAIQWSKDSLFNKGWNNWTSTSKKWI